MASVIPRAPYTPSEIEQLYHPNDLELRQVQVILRHGERTPVSPRFQNAGLAAYWPYCSVAKQMTTTILATNDWSQWNGFEFSRLVETQGQNDIPVIARGPREETSAICMPGELTDLGRQTTLALGQRLRYLYVDQLKFMPNTLSSTSDIYLRATPIVRALESVQQTFTGFYPPADRAKNLPRLDIVMRSPADETLFPNEHACRRFKQLFHAFADRASQRWNDSPEMDYINKKLGKWMPEKSPRIAVDSHPRLSGIMDTMNSTLAHGPDTKLPSEFYDPKVVRYMDKIVVQEWFDGYNESRELRMLGIGGLVADMTTRMIMHAESNQMSPSGTDSAAVPKLALSGAHDTTIAGFLASLGAFNRDPWPPYTSHIAVELFRKSSFQTRQISSAHPKASSKVASSWWSSIPLLSSLAADFTPPSKKAAKAATPQTMSSRKFAQLNGEEKQLLQDHYVRIRYNDRPVQIPGCSAPGKHLEGDASFCTLEAFKAIVDDFAPSDWKSQCMQNLDAPRIPQVAEPSGLLPSS